MKKITIILFALMPMFMVAKDKQKIESQELIKQITDSELSVTFQNLRIIDGLDFTKVDYKNYGKTSVSTVIEKNRRRSDTTRFYSKKGLVTIENDLLFSNCSFSDKIRTKKYGKENNISIKLFTHFSGNLIFKDCVFKEKVDFSMVQFHQNIEFHNCKFEDEFDIEAANIKGSFVISDCTFSKNLLANNLQLDDKFSLTNNEFQGHLEIAGAVFKMVPDFMGSSFNRKIKIRNTRVNERPLFWYFEDEEVLQKYLEFVMYDKTFYNTRLEHQQNITVYSSRTNFGKDIRKKVLALWDAKAFIRDANNHTWKVEGRIIWDKTKNILIVEKGNIMSPEMKVVVKNENFELDIDNPAHYILL